MKMTIEDVLNRQEDMLFLYGEEKAAFADALEASNPLNGHLAEIRNASHLLGVKRWTMLDETPRVRIAQALGREWFIPA